MSIKTTTPLKPLFLRAYKLGGASVQTYNFFMVKQKVPLNNRNFEKIYISMPMLNLILY